MNQTDFILTYFKLNEKERRKAFLYKTSQDYLCSKKFAVGRAHFVILEDDGTVTSYGDNNYGQCDIKDWKDIAKIVAGDYHTVALLKNGTVCATGDNSHGQCNVLSWRNIVDIFAMNHLTVGVYDDGSVIATSSETNQNTDTSADQHRAQDNSERKEESSDSISCVCNLADFIWEETSYGIMIKKYKGNSYKVVIPEEIYGNPVCVIGEGAFCHNSSINRVSFPKSLRTIQQSAFDSCSMLEIIKIPFGLVNIDSHAFYLCRNIKKLSLPNSVKEIGALAFGCCYGLTEIELPDSLIRVKVNAFKGCRNLNNLVISSKTRKRIDPKGVLFGSVLYEL